MDTYFQLSAPTTVELNSDAIWATLYLLLLPLATRWVYASNTFSWIGQEVDVAWDIVLVSVQRTYEYALKAQRENIPIASIQRLGITIAKHYFQDLRRKDCRLQPLDRDESSQVERSLHDEMNIAEAVIDKIHEEWLFHELAKAIAGFPPKLRTAILIDISLRSEFDSQPSPLQTAFLEAGVRLQEYQSLLPTDPVAKSRHSSLVSLGYKRIARLVCLL